jgi:hypothetical protein
LYKKETKSPELEKARYAFFVFSIHGFSVEKEV